MTVSTTPRLGLTKWSAGTDPFTRAQANADADALELVVPVCLMGLYASRPAPGTQRRLYWATDRAKLYFDDGSAWTQVQALNAGDIIMSGGSGVSVGFLECDGSAVSRTTYAEMFANLGGAATPWGVGDGSTTFNLPNFANKVPWGRGTPALGATAAVGSHVHTDSGHAHGNTLGVVTNNFSTGTVSADHAHHGSTAGANNGNPSFSHVHSDTAYGAGQWSGPPDVNMAHGHAFDTGGADANHSHTANHGHTMSGGVSTGNAAIAAATVLNGLGVRFLIKT